MRQTNEGHLKHASKRAYGVKFPLLSQICCCWICHVAFCFGNIFFLEYCFHLLYTACEHHLWNCKHIYYCQILLKCPSLSIPFCLSWQSWQLMCYFLLWWVSDSLVLILAVTLALCCFSSGKTGHIWSGAEFAISTNLNPLLSLFSTLPVCIYACSFLPPQQCMVTHLIHVILFLLTFQSVLSSLKLWCISVTCCSFFSVFSRFLWLWDAHSLIFYNPTLTFFYVQQCFTIPCFPQNVSSKCQLPLKK